MIYLKEISPDRRELRFSHVAVPEDEHSQHEGMLQEFVDTININFEPTLNFGQNRLFKIINQLIFEDHDLVVRLLDPLPNDIEEESTAWIVNELVDSYTDTILIEGLGTEDVFTELRGPNFEIETKYTKINETNFASWNEILGSSIPTSQQIIDKMFSGSLKGIELGIDYTGFQNFVNFSSAAERLKNFKHKVEMIEYYDDQITTLNSVSESNEVNV
ncbi:MAG TPA: hypothetical protein DCM40_43610, partial [Maribacter sp.]|nr:hypothetical protein [Maribacter sp.]